MCKCQPVRPYFAKTRSTYARFSEREMSSVNEVSGVGEEGGREKNKNKTKTHQRQRGVSESDYHFFRLFSVPYFQAVLKL